MRASSTAAADRVVRAVKTDPRAGKYLTFELGPEEFGIPVLKVREIMGVQDMTAAHQTPACVKGVINLRGKPIPVVDLRLKFGLNEIPHTQRTCVIVVQVAGDAGPMPMGIVVDGVSEVLNVAAGDVEDTRDSGQGATTPHILGMAKVKGKVIILLEIDQVLSSQDLQGIARLVQCVAAPPGATRPAGGQTAWISPFSRRRAAAASGEMSR